VWAKKLLFVLAFFVMSSDLAAADPAQTLDGDWDGALAVSALKLRFTLHIETHDGTTSGSLTSIDQGGTVLQLATVTRDGSTVSFSLVKPNASFQGTLSADGTSMAGNWMQNGNSLPLSFARRAAGAAGPVLNRPQEPHLPYPYRSEDVVYDGAGGIKLAGTLTMPDTGSHFAAAILIAGSGPHNRDEALMGHKPFLVLSDYLTRHGIAVLRSDKRGIGHSTGDFATATSEDFANDVESAIVYLKTRTEIDPKKIGLIGHSEGGLIAPIVAAKDRSVAFIVLMAGPGLTGEQILIAQRHLIGQAMGQTGEELARRDALQVKMLDAAKAATDDDAGRAKIRAIIAEGNPQLPPAAIDATAAQLTSPWFRFFLSYDPVPTLREVRCPVLAINGEKDLQVPPKEDLAAIKAALAANPDATTIELPGLNHLFQTAKTGAPSEYGDIEETIAPVALDTITLWIVKHT
jgi:uncharacterized protein